MIGGSFILLALLLYRFYPASLPAPPLPLVTLVLVEKSNFVKTVDIPGVVQSLNSVNIRSRVEGVVQKVHFQEGQLVQKGDLLYSIEPDTYKFQVEEAEARLQQSLALLEQANLEYGRDKTLLKKGFVSPSKYGDQVSQKKNLESQVAANKATLGLNRLQLQYTEIVSPVTGRVGFNAVTVGNLVKPMEGVTLTSVNQLDPIDIVFSIPEQFFGEVQTLEGLAIHLTSLQGQEIPLEESGVGKVYARDNTISQTSGSILLKARVANKKNQLHPGQYVNITLDLKPPETVLSISALALQMENNQSYVFLYDKKSQKVKRKPVVVKKALEEKVFIQNGLKEGDLVVQTGHLFLEDGMRVRGELPKESTKDSRGATSLQPNTSGVKRGSA